MCKAPKLLRSHMSLSGAAQVAWAMGWAPPGGLLLPETASHADSPAAHTQFHSKVGFVGETPFHVINI